MLKVMCGVELTDRKNTSELMIVLGLIALTEMAAKANALRWFGYVLRVEEHLLRRHRR